jgi:hypothetical protein
VPDESHHAQAGRAVQRATDGDEASGIAYKTGQVVRVYSNSAKQWADAKVISIENGIVTVQYTGPDGPMKKRLEETDKSLRLKEQVVRSRNPTGVPDSRVSPTDMQKIPR